jgi:hypothetical protein
MKHVLLIAVGAFLGATVLTLFFLPACLHIVNSAYCMPLSSLFPPLLARLGAEGGAPGVFQSIWLGYFAWLAVGLSCVVLMLRARRR